MIRSMLEVLPLWGVFLTTVVIVALFTECGYRFGLRRSLQMRWDDESHVNATTGAQLALMGFILAFTFSLAADHHGERQRLILEEIVAVESAYLRAELVPDRWGEPIREGLRDYVYLTATAGQLADHEVAQMLRDAQQLRVEIWAQVTRLTQDHEAGEMEALLVDSVNRVFEVHERRVAAALRHRIPRSIWSMLYGVLALSMFGMGYFSGIKGKRSAVTGVSMTLSLAIVLWLIADLDRPQTGIVKADLSSLQELGDKLRGPLPDPR